MSHSRAFESSLAVRRCLVVGFVLPLFCLVPSRNDGAEAAPAPALASLLARIGGQQPGDIVRNPRSEVVSIRLREHEASDRNLALVKDITTLRELTLQGQGTNQGVTAGGIRHLAHLTNLMALRLSCLGQMHRGVFEEICRLRQLREVSLTAACPEAREYSALSNLTALSSLLISYCPSFDDDAMAVLPSLPTLDKVELKWNGLTKRGTNVLSRIPLLTNAVISLKRN